MGNLDFDFSDLLEFSLWSGHARSDGSLLAAQPRHVFCSDGDELAVLVVLIASSKGAHVDVI